MPLPDWSRAFGLPLFTASLRTTPEDFDVTEELGFEFDGEGDLKLPVSRDGGKAHKYL